MNQQALTNPITEDDIANYLANSPDFFQRHAELLASVHLASPHNNRAVSLQERQAEMLRDKIKLLEHRLMDMIRHGNENALLANRLLRWLPLPRSVRTLEETKMLAAASLQDAAGTIAGTALHEVVRWR